MAKIFITVFAIGLLYGIHAEETVEQGNTDVEANDQQNNQLDNAPQVPQWPENFPSFPPHPRINFPNRPRLGQFGNPGFQMPRFEMPKMLTPEDIEKMVPKDENSHVAGAHSSFSSSMKVVNGKVVENEKSGQIITNVDGEVQKEEFSK